MFNLISRKLANSLTTELGYNDDKGEIISYAIETALLAILGALLIVVLSYVLNVFLSTVIAAAFGGLLRRVSGGAHFNTPYKCLAFGAIIYCALGILAVRIVEYNLANTYFLLLLLLVALLIVYYLAPVDSEAKPIHSKTLKMKLKTLSVVFVIISLVIIQSSSNQLFTVSAVLGVIYQCITLLPIFNKKGGELDS
ncbi:MAG: accessory gene regulator B family protein [Bacillota bacterium]|nr:accessory gene regulator B family protein [Bacillota bacterium]